MQTRKEFIIQIARITSLTLLASTTGYLLFREESDEKCELDFVCGNCSKLKKCGLEQGQKHRAKSKLPISN